MILRFVSANDKENGRETRGWKQWMTNAWALFYSSFVILTSIRRPFLFSEESQRLRRFKEGSCKAAGEKHRLWL